MFIRIMDQQFPKLTRTAPNRAANAEGTVGFGVTLLNACHTRADYWLVFSSFAPSNSVHGDQHSPANISHLVVAQRLGFDCEIDLNRVAWHDGLYEALRVEAVVHEKGTWIGFDKEGNCKCQNGIGMCDAPFKRLGGANQLIEKQHTSLSGMVVAVGNTHARPRPHECKKQNQPAGGFAPRRFAFYQRILNPPESV
jgi:hypothetical protein